MWLMFAILICLNQYWINSRATKKLNMITLQNWPEPETDLNVFLVITALHELVYKRLADVLALV